MKFVCNKDILSKEINMAKSCISQKNNSSLLSNVFLFLQGDNLIVRTTDSKNWFESTLSVTGSEDGEIGVFCDKFFADLNALPSGDISLSTNGNYLELKSLTNEKFDAKNRFNTAEAFPKVFFPTAEQYFSVEQKDFIKMIDNTSFAISKEGSNSFIMGACLTKEESDLVMVATDGRRLSLVKNTNTANLPDIDNIIISPNFIGLIKSLASKEGMLNLAIVDRTIFADFNGVKIASVLIEGHFPNYKRVIPENMNHLLKFNRNSFLEALNFVNTKTDSRTHMFLITFEENKAVLKATNADVGENRVEIEAEYTNLNTDEPALSTTPITLALNSVFVADPLKSMNDKYFCFKLTNDQYKPVIIASLEDESYFHLVMPLS